MNKNTRNSIVKIVSGTLVTFLGLVLLVILLNFFIADVASPTHSSVVRPFTTTTPTTTTTPMTTSNTKTTTSTTVKQISDTTTNMIISKEVVVSFSPQWIGFPKVAVFEPSPTDTLTACQDLCTKHSNCSAFVYLSRMKVCNEYIANATFVKGENQLIYMKFVDGVRVLTTLPGSD